jgi:hypothetical protein
MSSPLLQFPDDDYEGPPKKKRSVMDEIIDNIFQVLPAESALQISDRLKDRGVTIGVQYTRGALRFLRAHSDEYQWTVPHVSSVVIPGDLKYFHLLLEKDGTFHCDPMFLSHLADGTEHIVKRIATESRNQCGMLRAAANATYLRPNIRQELREMADECAGIHSKARRVLRYLKDNGLQSNGQ